MLLLIRGNRKSRGLGQCPCLALIFFGQFAMRFLGCAIGGHTCTFALLTRAAHVKGQVNLVEHLPSLVLSLARVVCPPRGASWCQATPPSTARKPICHV